MGGGLRVGWQGDPWTMRLVLFARTSRRVLWPVVPLTHWKPYRPGTRLLIGPPKS